MNIAILLIGVILIIIALIFWAVLSRKTYKNIVHIARQTGKHDGDVIWFSDKFRVINKDGAWIIEFQKLREKTRSVEGKWWTKMLKPGSHRKMLKIDPEDWLMEDMRSHVTRGLFMYETNEGEYYPMNIIRDEKGAFLFSVLDQDNRQFVITETQAVNDLTRDRKQEVRMIWAIVIGMFVFAIIAFGGMWWVSHMHDANIAATAQVCSEFAGRAYSQIGVNQTQYLNQLVGVLGG